MARHDYIGDIRIEFAKDAVTGVPVASSSVEAGDHEVLLLVVTYASNSAVKNTTVTLQDSENNSDWTDIAGGTISIDSDGKDVGQKLLIVERRKHGRYIRANFTSTGTGHASSAAWLKMGDKVRATETRTDLLVV